MNNFFLLVIMIFSTFNGFTQNDKMKDKMKDKMNIEDITEIWVYDYFNPQGYRRGEVSLKFRELENKHTTKIQLDSVFVDSLKNILIDFTTPKKFLMRNEYGQALKCGGNFIFTQFVLKNNSNRNIIIAPYGIFDYEVDLIGYFFIDSAEKTQWKNNFWDKICGSLTHDKFAE